VTEDAKYVSQSVLDQFFNFLTSNKELDLNHGLTFKIRVLSIAHCAYRHQIKQNITLKGIPTAGNGLLKCDSNSRYLFRTGDGFITQDHAFKFSCLILAVIIGRLFRKWNKAKDSVEGK
jgi:hypothetical protein